MIALSRLLLGLALVLYASPGEGNQLWKHPMHAVYQDSAVDDQTSPAGGHQGKFLSLSRDELIRMKRALRKIPYQNTPLELIYKAAVRVENGEEVDVSLDDLLPNPERELYEALLNDEEFEQVVDDYLQQDLAPGQVIALDEDIPAPEDREQSQGYDACFADYDAYIGPLTQRWVWDYRTLNFPILTPNVPPRPPGPDSNYAFLLDATGRRPTGLFEGNFHWLASIQECTTTVILHEVNVSGVLENRTFQGRYARLDMPITISDLDNATVAYARGVCVPDTCTKEDVRAYLTGANNVTSYNEILANLYSNWNLEDVYMGQETDWDNDIPAKAALGILLGGGILLIISSCYDGWGRHRIIRKNIKKRARGFDDKTPLTNEDLRKANKYLYEEPGIKDKLEVALAGYSVYSNLKNMMTTHPRYKPYHIPALDGLRAITIMWITYGMTYVYGIVYFECWTNGNLISAFQHYMQEHSIMPILQSWYANTTLFFISGFVCTQMWYRHWTKKNKKVGVGMVINWLIGRYLSIIPAMMGMLMIYTCLTPYISDGPMQPRKVTDSSNCRETWWVVMLLFHNLFKTDQQCFAWSWMYGAVWQLNIASLFALIPLVILPIAGYVVIGAMYIAHIIILAIWNQQTLTDEKSWFWDILQTPWCNAGPYCIGMILAIMMRRSRGKRSDMSWPLILIFWIVSACFLGIVVYAPWSRIKPDSDDWSDAGHVAFDTLAPQMLAFAVAWITWACYNDFGGVVGGILNWKFFTALSKLALPATLFMGPAMTAHFYARERLFYIADSHMSYLYHGQLIAVLISGLVVAISFQYPVSRSLKIQAVAISRLELLLHSRHPPILDQLTGDPKEDEPFWDNLEKNREKEAPPTAATPAVLLKGGKPIGGFTPCQDTITDSYAEIKYPVVSLEKVSNGVAKQENIYTDIRYEANKTTDAVNHAYVTDDVTAL